MIKLVRGDILGADAEALINTVNCVGVMGRGIALQFRKAFPDNFKAYEALCARDEIQVGKVFCFDLHRFENPRYVINFPTKRHWKGKSELADIHAGLNALVEEIRKRHIQSVAVPPLGCGLGGLDWNEVKPLIEQAFEALPDVRVLLFEPAGAPSPEEMVKYEKQPLMTEGRATLLGLMRRYLAAVMDPYVTLLEIHKLMYFMQESGQELKLNYTKWTYGPYANNLRHVLSHIEGHFIVGYGDAEDKPDKEITPKVEAMVMAEDFLANHPGVQERFNRVVDLIDGFETPFGMELLSTVHWVAKHEGALTLDDVVKKTYEWGSRKKMFEERHIDIAWKVLRSKGWVTSK